MNLTELKAALSQAPEPTDDLLNEVYAYCDSKNETPDKVFARLLPMVAKMWSEAAAKRPYKRKSKAGKKLEHASATNDLITNTFYVVSSNDGSSHRLYPITDKGMKLLAQPIDYNTMDATAISNVGRELNMALAAQDNTPRYFENKVVNQDLQAFFMTDLSENPQPKLYAQPDDEDFCLSRRTVVEDESQPFPDWERFLSGFEDPEAFAAKIYAIVSGRDTSRQALVVRSEGKTGKSCAMNAIKSIFGVSAKALAGSQVNQSSRFIASHYRDTALIYVPDTNSKTILLTETVKMLTGSDDVQYEVKFGGFGQYKANAKLVVFMNPRPLVLAEEHSISRCLYLEQTKIPFEDIGADEFTKRLEDQLGGFLAYGKKAFAHKWQNNKIVLNDKAQDTFNLLVGSEKQEFYDWLGRYFVVGDEEAEVSSLTVNKNLEKVKSLSRHERAQWREWLEDMEEITVRKTQRQTYYCGLALRTTALTNAVKNSKMGDA